jgi:hypothetical protein
MTSLGDSTSVVALQILFGFVGISSVIVALFGLHYRDSLGFVLYRRFRRRSAECTYPMIGKAVACCVQALIVPLAYELEEGTQYLDSTTASQRLSVRNPSVQDLP